MTRFTAATRAEAVVLAPRQDIWNALVDPVLMARFTPFLKQIKPDGDHWRWEMSGMDVLGVKVAPSFTERMVFSEPTRIAFHHDPPAGVIEKAGVAGWYRLTPADASAGGAATELVTELEITIDLPLPRVSGRAVRAAMSRVIDSMGDRFAQNLLDHLGAEQRPA